MRRPGITGKLVFYSLCILVALGMGVTLYSVNQLRDLRYQDTVRRVEAQTLNWIEANSERITLLLEVPSKDKLEGRRQIEYLANLGDLATKEWIAYVILMDSNGQLRAATPIPDGLVYYGPTAEVQGSKSRVMEMVDAKRLHYFELATPVLVSGTGMNPDLGAMFEIPATSRALGEVRIGVDRKQFESHLAVLIRRTIQLSAALVLLAIVASVLFSRRMVKPITLLARVATQIAHGELSTRASHGLELKDEVGDLVRNFNQMADRLESLHTGLEEKVRERTQQLEEANRKLQDLNKLKSDFVSTVSHELRTPLTSIKAFAEILLDARSPNPGTQRRYLEIINKESDRLTRLIAEMLDLTKIESGTLDWQMSCTDLGDIIRQSEELLVPQAKEKGIELEIAELQPHAVMADSDRLQQVVNNLVGNAIKFCPEGGRVQVCMERASTSGPRNAIEGEYVRVVVCDNGPGIPLEEHEKIFERFYQGAKRSSVGAGAGLGLTICRAIISHHQGEIWVDSAPGQGSRFSFTLPRRHLTGAEFLTQQAGR